VRDDDAAPAHSGSGPEFGAVVRFASPQGELPADEFTRCNGK